MNLAQIDIGFAHDRTTGKEDWLTPPRILRALGHFDLDPCASITQPWATADKHFTIVDNGLLKPWVGRVWLNPSYGNQTEKWIMRLADHENGVALIYARTETKVFFPWVWDYANAVLFLKGRISFFTKEGMPSGSSGAPCVLVAYGNSNADILGKCGIEGKFIRLIK